LGPSWFFADDPVQKIIVFVREGCAELAKKGTQPQGAVRVFVLLNGENDVESPSAFRTPKCGESLGEPPRPREQIHDWYDSPHRSRPDSDGARKPRCPLKVPASDRFVCTVRYPQPHCLKALHPPTRLPATSHSLWLPVLPIASTRTPRASTEGRPSVLAGRLNQWAKHSRSFAVLKFRICHAVRYARTDLRWWKAARQQPLS